MRNNSMEVLNIINSAIAQKILAYYFTNAGEDHYLRELAAILDEDAGNLSRILTKLEKEGILNVSFSGNQKFFSLNKEYPLFNELSGLVEKTVGVVGSLKNELSRIDGISAAFIYGSMAKKNDNSASDIDLFVVGKFKEDELLKAVDRLEKRLGREINYVFYSREGLNKARKTDSFVKSVLRESKIMILGEEDEL